MIVGAKGKARLPVGPKPKKEGGPPHYREEIACSSAFEKSMVNLQFITMGELVVAVVENKSTWPALIKIFRDNELVRNPLSEETPNEKP